MQLINLETIIKAMNIGETPYYFMGNLLMGTPDEWDGSNYTPAHGELIVYDIDGRKQFKIGDGKTSATELDYANLIEIDDKLNADSENPVQNKAICNFLKAPTFGATVQIVGGDEPTDNGRVEVYRQFSNYSASNRKFAAYEYNSFFTTDKLINGKPLRVCTLIWPELQLDAYSNQNAATDSIIEDYNANPDRYYDNEDCIRRDINIYYPLKDGQIAVIEKGGILNAHNFVGDTAKVGATHTGWLIFENDDAKNGSPNRMFNEYWDLYKVGHISAPIADVTFKNLYSQTVRAPWFIFENDGGTQTTYNRLYNDWWKLNKLTSIEAPQAEATFKKVIAGESTFNKVIAGETRTDWVIFKNDEATMGAPNRMFNDSWQLSKLTEIKAAAADTWLKNVHLQALYASWLVFDNDGGTTDTYNRLYNEWWKLNKLKTIEAPIADAKLKSVGAVDMYAGYLTFSLDEGIGGRRSVLNGADWTMQMLEKFEAPSADASFRSVKVNGDAVATAKDIGDIDAALDNIIAIQNSLMGVAE